MKEITEQWKYPSSVEASFNKYRGGVEGVKVFGNGRLPETAWLSF